MADLRFGDVNWGRENLQCTGGEGALFVERSQGEKERVGERAACSVHKRHHHVRIPQTELEENMCLPRGHLEGDIASPRTKGLLGAIERPFNSRGRRLTQRADNLVANFHCASPLTPGTCISMQLLFCDKTVPGAALGGFPLGQRSESHLARFFKDLEFWISPASQR